MATAGELEYLRRQKAKQELARQQGVQSINPGQSNEGEDTSWSSLAQANGLTNENQYNKENGEWYEKPLGVVDSIFGNIGEGFLSFFEGFADLGANIIGGIGDATGLYDSKPFTDWSQINVSKNMMDWAKVYWGSPWQTIKNMADGEYGNQEYWQSMFGSIGDIFTKQDGLADEKAQFYGYNDRLESEPEQFIGGIAESFGRMIPTIASAGTASAAGWGPKATKALSVGLMSGSVAGSSSAEALSEGATAGQALAYGAASGLVEGATEYIFPDGSVNGAITSNMLKELSIKGFAKEMVQEGFEEIASALVEPAIKSIYKGDKAYEEYKTGDFWKGVLLSGASGAVSSGLISGMTTAGLVKQYGGMKQYQTVQRLQMNQEAYESTIDQYKNKKLSFGQANAKLQDIVKQMKECADEIKGYDSKFGDAFFGKAKSQAQFESEQAKLVELKKIATPTEYSDYLKTYRSDQINDFVKSLSQMERTDLSLILNAQFNEATEGNVVFRYADEQDFKKHGQFNGAYVEYENGIPQQVLINPDHADQFAQLIGHEGIIHAFIDKSPAVRAKLISQLEKDDYEGFHANDKKILAAYAEQGITEDSELFKSEQLAHYVERSVGNYNQLLKVAAGKYGFLSALKDSFGFAKKVGNIKAMMAVSNAMKALQAAGEIGKVQGRPAVQFAKDGVNTKKSIDIDSDQTDSDGKPLTKQAEVYFKKSKVRDKTGHLLRVFHGTIFQQRFDVFDSTASSRKGLVNNFGDVNVNFFTSSRNVANEYARAEGENGQLYEVYLDIEKPFILQANGKEAALLASKKADTIRQKAFESFKQKWSGVDLSETDIEKINSDLAVLDISVEKNEYGYYNIVQHSIGNELTGGDVTIGYSYDLGELLSEDYGLNDIEETLGSPLSTNQIVNAILWSNKHLGSNYDGIIFRNVYDGLSRKASDKSDVFVTFKSNQIKDVDNENPSNLESIRFSKDLNAENKAAKKPAPVQKGVSQQTLDQVIDGFFNTIDNYKEELAITAQEHRDMERAMRSEFASEARFIKSYTPLAQQLVAAHINSKIHDGGILKIPSEAENIALNAERVVLLPFSKSGVVKDGKLQMSVFVPAIRDLADNYTPEKFGALYNAGIAMQLANMYQWEDSGTAIPTQEQSALALYKALRKLSGDNFRNVELQRIRGAAEADYAFSELGIYKDDGLLVRNMQKIVAIVSDPRASLDMFVSELSPIGDKLINEGSKQAGFAHAYQHEARAKIAEIQKELGINKKMDNIVVNGVSMPYLGALEWQLMLSMEQGTKELANAVKGYSFHDQKTDKQVIVEYNEQAQKDLDKAFSAEFIEKAHKLIVDDFYGTFIYDKIAEVYKRATGMDYGELMPRGQYMRLATRQLRTSLLTPKITNVASTSNLMERSAKPGPIDMRGGLFSKMSESARMTAYETFLQPLATEVDHLLNTIDNDGKTLLSKMGVTKQQFLKWYMDELTGAIKPEAMGGFGQAMVALTLTNFKIGPTQTLSAFTSGLSVLEQFNPRLMKHAVKPSGKYETALKNLYTVVPEAKYRGESNDVYYGNVGEIADNAFSRHMKQIGEFASKLVGTNAYDRAAVRYILLSALNTEAKRLKLPIDDIRVAEAAEHRARQLYMTQISNDSRNFSPAQMVSNPFGSMTATKSILMRMVRMYGGAAKAFTNFFNRTVLRLARMNRAGKWLSQHNIGEYEKAIGSAKQAVEDVTGELEDANGELEVATQKRIELRDKRTKDKAKTEMWEKAREKVRDLQDKLDEAKKDNKRKAEVEGLQQQLDEAKKEASNLTSGFSAKSQFAYEQAKDEEDLARKKVRSLEKALRKAENAVAEAEGHKDFYEKTLKTYTEWKKNGMAGKSVANLLAGLLLAGVGKTLIDLIYNLLFKKKEWKDLKVEEIVQQTALNSTLNLYPGLRSIASVIQGNEVSDPSTRTISLLFDTAQSVSKFAQDQSEGNRKAMMRNGLQILGLVTGVPFKTVYDQVTGIMGWANPEVALDMRNVFYQVSSTATAKMNDAIEKGDTKLASSYLRYVTNERVGEIAESQREEMLRLASAGESIVPSSVTTSFTNSKGDEVTITWSQQQEAKKHYSKANSQVASLVKAQEYKKMNDAQKARAIRSVYTAFRSAALAKAIGKGYDVELNRSALLAKTGDGKTGVMLAAVAYIRSLEATKNLSKKELAVAYVNRLAGLSRGEKLIVLKLAGYSADITAIKATLMQKGLTRQEAEKFVS